MSKVTVAGHFLYQRVRTPSLSYEATTLLLPSLACRDAITLRSLRALADDACSWGPLRNVESSADESGPVPHGLEAKS
jgi:hypothetical protein